jgi:hypothetical protein
MTSAARAARIPLVVLSLAVCSAAYTADRELFTIGPKVRSPDIQEPEPWKEKANLHLPDWPKDADLVEFHTSDPSTPFRYYIDTKSLSVDTQQVVRYTVVVKSASGGSNVSYEGIRCTPTGEYRLYAYGVGGKFEPVPDSPWRGVLDPAVPRYAADLERYLLCVPLKFEPRPVKEMPRILSGHGHPRDNSGFLTD